MTSSPAGIDCGSTCSALFDHGTEVTLSQEAAAGSKFSGWSGACSGTGTTCTVNMNEAKEVGAVFAGPSKPFSPAEALTVSKGGSGESRGYGTVKAAGLTCETECDETTVLYQGPVTEPKAKAGKTVVLKAVSAPGSKAVEWTGCESNPSPSECAVTMESAKAVTAKFDELE